MKIGIVLSNTPQYSETFFKSKIIGLQKSGMDVCLITQSKRRKFKQCPVYLAPPIFKLNPFFQLIWFVWVMIKLLFHVKTVFKFIKLEREDGVSWRLLLKRLYSNSHILTKKFDWLHFGFATMALGKENVAKSMGAKMAVSFRGFDLSIYPVKHPNCYHFLWEKVDKVHTISNDLLELAIKNGLSSNVPIQKITPAIDASFFKSKDLKNTNPSNYSMITIARLHWKKGLILTIRALSVLKEKGLNFNYTIVGVGVMYEELKFIIHQLNLEEHVSLVGEKSPEEVKDLLSKHSIYIQYSISEGFCNAVLEAQAMGLLCIVSDAEGLAENVLDGKTGWVVPKRNPEKLAATILKVVDLSVEAKDNIRSRAIKRVQAEFNIEKQQMEFVKFYNDLV